ncbi:MAG: hypothetical protein ACFFHD_06205 [Promethearchaeota archaeon]
MSEEKEALKQLIMLISDLRAKDEERYASHVEFMNETIRMISAIESQMNKHWKAVLDSLNELNSSIKSNLDSLLTGINPKGLRETSKSLKEIMDTMNKSVQTMNLEKVLSELKVLKSGELVYMSSPQPVTVGQQPEPINPSMSLKPLGSTTTPSSEPEWVDPHEKKKKEEDDQHLLKPSDFFGSKD